MSGANAEKYEPFATLMKSPESRPSEPKITARFPCSRQLLVEDRCAFAAICHGRKTTSVSLEIRVTSDEKSVWFWFTDSRVTVAPPAAQLRLDAVGERDAVRASGRR